jgi:hypothetical protein
MISEAERTTHKSSQSKFVLVIVRASTVPPHLEREAAGMDRDDTVAREWQGSERWLHFVVVVGCMRFGLLEQ